MPPEAVNKQADIHEQELLLEPQDNIRLANLSGQFDEHLHYLERQAHVELHHRGNQFLLMGAPQDTELASACLQSLYEVTKDKELTMEDIHLALREQQTDYQADETDEARQNNNVEPVVINTHYGKVRGRGSNQEYYLHSIQHNDVNFGIGPAGTGKTYLAVACAVDALEYDQIRKIVLVRPAVEAGERLGFLPGDLSQKVDPYLRPLYDALYEMMGMEKVTRLIERGVIEIAPLAYMRGRTLNDSFIILDEAQNTTIEQMKMFLTRIGFGSTAVITGDVTQIDLSRDHQSGLKQVINVLRDIDGISFTFFKSRDVVRHPLVQRIVDAYDHFNRPESDGD